MNARLAIKPLKVLLTGFGPFPGTPLNPTGPLVRRLARSRHPGLANVTLAAHIFPTSYWAVDEELPRLILRLQPDAVLMFGLAARRRVLTVETQARNAVSALLRDARGHAPPLRSIIAGGPRLLRFEVPARKLAHAARRARVPAQISADAGRYVCNYLCWRALETAAKPGGPRLAVFVHVPKLRPAALRRGWRKRMPMGMPELLRGGEAILLGLVAAARATKRVRI